MKRTFRGVYTTLILAVSFVALAACSKDDTEGGTSKPVELPEIADLHVVAGDSNYIEFEAAAVWTLSSDKMWVQFDSYTGKAGSQKVKYTITTAASGFDENTATVTLKIGSKSMNFKIIRLPEGRKIKFYTRVEDPDAENPFSYQEIESIELAYVDRSENYVANFAVVANFDWKIDPKAAASMPAWLSINDDDRSGTANEGAEADLTKLTYKWISLDFSKTQADEMSGDIIFSDIYTANATFKLSVKSPGSKEFMMAKAPEELVFTNKGKYIGGSSSSSTLAENFQLPVISEKGVKFFFLLKDDRGYYGPANASTGWMPKYDADWLSASIKNSTTLGAAVKRDTCQIIAAPNSSDLRYATIVAIPTDIAGSKTEEELVNMDGDAILPEYQKYIVSEVKQEGPVGLAYMYADPQYMTGIELSETSEEVKNELPEQYRGLLSNTMNYISVDRYTVSMSAVKIAGWSYSSEDDSHIVISYIIDGEVTNQAPTWFVGESSNLGSGSYMVFSFAENPKWTASRNVWLLIQEYQFNGDNDEYLRDIMTIKITQNNNNYEDEEWPL